IDASEDPPQGIQFAFLSLLRFLRNQGTLHRFGEQHGHVQVRNVEEHRLAVLRKDREEMRELPSALDCGIRGKRGILATGEKRRDPHSRCKGHPREKDSERTSLTLFKVDSSTAGRERFMALWSIRPRAR